MVNTLKSPAPDFAGAFAAQERQERIHTGKIACALVVFLMPLGVVLDFFVYPKEMWLFLAFRLICSVLAGGLWFLHATQFGHKYYRLMGIPIALLPAFFIAWMIYVEGPESPYYAGLNLILLSISLVVRWNTIESVLAVGGVLLMYLIACSLKGTRTQLPILFNNFYFLSLTGVIVVIGNHFFERLRFREFTLRYQLDKSKQELQETNHKLVELDKLKSRFFANVSHEMRTPLTLLLGPLETLAKRFEKAIDNDTRDLLQTMHNNGMRLLKLINDLLELIRLESGRLEVKAEPLSVREFVGGLTNAVKQMAAEKQITLEVKVPSELNSIMADRDKLEKTVLNLLFNALKFTSDGGRIWLHANKVENDFVLLIGDTGKGIAEKNLPFVFDRFWQEDNSAKRKYQGTGIGLALVKELTEAMDGTVKVQSQLGKGTVFTIRLPFKEVPPEQLALVKNTNAPSVPSESSHSEEWLVNLYRRAEFFPTATTRKTTNIASLGRQTNRPLVLVADDEPDMRRFLVSQLEDDYEVIQAVDGNEAVDQAQEAMPDVILLDLMMPHKDGLQVCQELRAYAPTVGIPIILLTARADEEAKFEALQMGANDFLAKPFSSIELQARIKNLIESHHNQRKLSKQNRALSEAIDQIKETEMQLVQSEKLSSLGRMSAGIIHEINNPLNFSLTGLFALRSKGKKLAPADRPEYEAIINDVEEGLKRVHNIVSDLRTFTHPGIGTGEPVEAADAADAALRFLGGEWRGLVDIQQQILATQTLWANRNKLIHVLINLVQNAIDALREKQFANGDGPKIWITGKTEGDRSYIMVRDNGPGIDQKNANKIFDPFFTTKEVGKGMGLGLSLCYRIVQGYGGKISVKSELGEFCEFTLDFPADADAAAEMEMEIENGEPVRL